MNKHIKKNYPASQKEGFGPKAKELWPLLCWEEPGIYTSTKGEKSKIKTTKTEEKKKNQHENIGVDVLPRVCIPLKNSLLQSVAEIHQ